MVDMLSLVERLAFNCYCRSTPIGIGVLISKLVVIKETDIKKYGFITVWFHFTNSSGLWQGFELTSINAKPVHTTIESSLHTIPTEYCRKLSNTGKELFPFLA